MDYKTKSLVRFHDLKMFFKRKGGVPWDVVESELLQAVTDAVQAERRWFKGQVQYLLSVQEGTPLLEALAAREDDE